MSLVSSKRIGWYFMLTVVRCDADQKIDVLWGVLGRAHNILKENNKFVFVADKKTLKKMVNRYSPTGSRFYEHRNISTPEILIVDEPCEHVYSSSKEVIYVTSGDESYPADIEYRVELLPTWDRKATWHGPGLGFTYDGHPEAWLIKCSPEHLEYVEKLLGEVILTDGVEPYQVDMVHLVTFDGSCDPAAWGVKLNRKYTFI